jgi:putative FmdB family regulatory protein
MPIYEYVCQECSTRFERIVMSQGPEIECPKCSSPRHTLVFSTFSAHAGDGKSSAGEASSGSGGCGCTPSSCGCH